MATNEQHKFPCPVCARPLQVKLTKKEKPYVTCDPCGVQVFIRGPADRDREPGWTGGPDRRDGAALPADVPRMRQQVLGRAGAHQDQRL